MSTNPRLKVNHTSTVAVRPELARSMQLCLSVSERIAAGDKERFRS